VCTLCDMRAWALALAAAGCSFQATSAGNTVPDDAQIGSDAPIADSSPLDGRAMASCLGGFLDICVDPPTTDVALMSDVDTTNSPMCAAYTAKYNGGQGAAEDQACVIAGLSITIPGGKTVNVTGNRKLILYATTGAITIAGTLDASSRRS
jgi:hypothetical protein